MPPRFEIRGPTCAQGERAVAIWRAAVQATHHFVSVQHLQDIDKLVCDFLPKAPLWLAINRNDYPIGFMLMEGGHMGGLFIDPVSSGMGAGRALVEHGLKLNASLTTDVNDQNAQAIGFYRHMGFVAIGRSEFDEGGRPYPLIHLRYERGAN